MRKAWGYAILKATVVIALSLILLSCVNRVYLAVRGIWIVSGFFWIAIVLDERYSPEARAFRERHHRQ